MIALSMPDTIIAARRSSGFGSSRTSKVSAVSRKKSLTIVIPAHTESPADWPSVNVTVSAMGVKSRIGVAVGRAIAVVSQCSPSWLNRTIESYN